MISLGFTGEHCHFKRGICHVTIIDNKVRMSLNYPGVDKEYFAPPIPSADELVKFIKAYSFD